MDCVGFDAHDHEQCRVAALANAERICVQKNLQLTPLRRHVLELLLTGHRAQGAYELLDQLRKKGLAAQPPVVYRVLDFLVRHGFVHRIERLNAFIACARPGETHAPCFLISTNCAAIAEAPGRSTLNALDRAAGALGFTVSRAAIEAEGLCPDCEDRV